MTLTTIRITIRINMPMRDITTIHFMVITMPMAVAFMARMVTIDKDMVTIAPLIVVTIRPTIIVRMIIAGITLIYVITIETDDVIAVTEIV